MTVDGWNDVLRERPAPITALVTVVAYVLVIGTFLGVIDVYPRIGLDTSTMLSHAIAIVNAGAVVCLFLGWYWIRQDRVRRHRGAMLTAFGLIVVFLLIYLLRIGGGGTKTFDGPTLVHMAYLVMLGVHVLLSILAVPLVVYVLLLGISHTPTELRSTVHARIGRIAASVWIVSLLLGLVTYVMLEHLYAWEYVT